MMFLMAPLVGGSTVFSHVAVTRAVGLTDDRVIRARNLGYLSVGLSLSQVLGPVIVGTTYDLYGARTAFAATAVLPLLSLVIIACGSHLFSVDRRASKEPPDRRRAINLMRLHGLRRWLIANGVFAAAITLIPMVMPLHAANVGISASVTSGIIAAVALGSITMRSFVAVLLARFRSEALLGGALAFAALTYSMLPFFYDRRKLVPRNELRAWATYIDVINLQRGAARKGKRVTRASAVVCKFSTDVGAVDPGAYCILSGDRAYGLDGGNHPRSIRTVHSIRQGTGQILTSA
jgi:MFS family permease